MTEQNTKSFFKTPSAQYITDVRRLLGGATPKYKIETYGCQMNVRDSQTLAGLLEGMGYAPAAAGEQADMILFNTCCVRENAELRVFGNLGALRKEKKACPHMLIGICGCMMQQQGMAQEIKKRFPFVDIVFGTHNTQCLPQLVFEAISLHKPVYSIWEKEAAVPEDMPVVRESTFSAWINITYGCNNFCSYCIVPYVRGRERSRSSGDILREARALAEEGCLEITLLGQNVNSYNNGTNDLTFPQLLRELNKIDGLRRIRFMTSHPKDLSDELIDVFAQCEKVSKYLHLPMQSGSSRILEKMNRRYTAEHYLQLTKKLKAAVPELALTTDIIVGFPGETEEDFLETMALYKEVCFHGAYTFKYSRRTGTPAAKMDGQVPAEEKKERLARLNELVNLCALEQHRKYIGGTYEVLVEHGTKRKNILSGKTDTARTVTFRGEESLIGTLVPVKITDAKSKNLSGELCPF